MSRSFGNKLAAFQKFYAADTDAARSQAVKDASRDRGLAMIDSWASQRIAKGKTHVYTYFFTHAEPGEGSDKFGAFHSSEIPYALATLDTSPERKFTIVDRQLSLTMSSYWVNFVRNGNPNGDGLPKCSPVTATSVPTMVLGSTVAPREILNEEKLAAYRAYVAQGGTLSMF